MNFCYETLSFGNRKKKKEKKSHPKEVIPRPKNGGGGDQEPIVYKYLLIKFFILYLFCPKP